MATFNSPNTGDTIQATDVSQFVKAWTGVAGYGVPIYCTQVNDAADYALKVKNLDATNGYIATFHDSAAKEMLAVKQSGLVIKGSVWAGSDTYTTNALNPFDIRPTLNGSGVTFTAFGMYVTDTASAAGTLLCDWQVGAVTKFAVYKNGRVGIGTTVSDTAMVLLDHAAYTATASTNIARLNIENTNAITVPAGTTAIAASLFVGEPNLTATGTVTDAASVYIEAAPTEGSANYALLIAAGTAALKGGAYLGATVTAAALVSQSTSGAGTTTHYIGNQTITTSSDSRVKTDVKEWQGSALDLLRQAEPLKEFRYNLPGGGPQDSGYGPNARGVYLGFVAQETRQWAPWVVNAGAGGNCPQCVQGQPCKEHSPWTVEYDHLVPLIIKGLQEIDARLARLGI